MPNGNLTGTALRKAQFLSVVENLLAGIRQKIVFLQIA